MPPPLTDAAKNQNADTGYDSDTGSIYDCPSSGSAVESDAKNPLDGYRTDFQPEGYQLDEPHFVSNPLKSFMQKAKLCLARLCLSPRPQGATSSAHSTSNPTNATQNQPTHSIGMSARHNQQLAFAHLIQAAQDDSGIFEFANSRAAIEHLDVLSNGNKLPDNHRLKTTTLGQIVAAKAAASGDLDLGGGYTLKGIQFGIDGRQYRLEPSQKLNLPNGNSQSRRVLLSVTLPDGQTKHIPCKLAFASTFSGTSMHEADIKFFAGELDSLKDFSQTRESFSSRRDPSKYQILSSSGCGRAAALASYSAVKEQINQATTLQQLSQINTDESLERAIVSGKQSFHPQFGLGPSLTASIKTALRTLKTLNDEILQSDITPNWVTNLKHRAFQPIPKAVVLKSQLHSERISEQDATHLHQNMGANHCYIEALNEFLGLKNQITAKMFMDTTLSEISSMVETVRSREKWPDVRDKLKLGNSDNSQKVKDLETYASLDTQRAQEVAPRWIARHRGDALTLLRATNTCLNNIHQSHSKNAYQAGLPKQVMMIGNENSESGAYAKQFLLSEYSAGIKNFIALQGNHAANCVKTDKGTWVRTDTGETFKNLKELAEKTTIKAVIVDEGSADSFYRSR